MAFSNKTLSPFKARKPHIAVRDGWWRVSYFPKEWQGLNLVQRRFDKAHAHVNKLNHSDVLKRTIMLSGRIPTKEEAGFFE